MATLRNPKIPIYTYLLLVFLLLIGLSFTAQGEKITGNAIFKASTNLVSNTNPLFTSFLVLLFLVVLASVLLYSQFIKSNHNLKKRRIHSTLIVTVLVVGILSVGIYFNGNITGYLSAAPLIETDEFGNELYTADSNVEKAESHPQADSPPLQVFPESWAVAEFTCNPKCNTPPKIYTTIEEYNEANPEEENIVDLIKELKDESTGTEIGLTNTNIIDESQPTQKDPSLALGFADDTEARTIIDEIENRPRIEAQKKLDQKKNKEAAYQLTYQLLNMLLKDYAIDAISDYCKEQYESSEPEVPLNAIPQNQTKTESGVCHNSEHIFTAQATKNNIEGTITYVVSWDFTSCKGSESFRVYLENSEEDREVIATGFSDFDIPSLGSKEISLEKNYNSICIDPLDETTVLECFEIVAE